MRLGERGPEVIEIAPGIDLEQDVLAQSGFPLNVAHDVRSMPTSLFQPEPMGLALTDRTA